MNRWLLLLAGLLLLTPPLGGAQDAGDEPGLPSIAVNYGFGSRATGAIAGSCTAGLAEFPATGGRLTLTAKAVSLTHLRTEANTTRYYDPNGDPQPLRQVVDQTRLDQPMGGGKIEVEWQNGAARIFGPGLLLSEAETDAKTFPIAFAASGLKTGPTDSNLHKNRYYIGSFPLVTTVYGVFLGWHRWVDFPSPAQLAVSGDLSLYLENATVRVGDQTYSAPPLRESLETRRAGAVEYERYRINHVILRLVGAEWTSAAVQPRLACSAMEYALNGSLVLLGASGNITAAKNASFAEKEFTVVGNFMLKEEPEDIPLKDGQVAAMNAGLAGSLEAVGYDFGPLEAIDLPAEADLSALLVAAGAAGALAGAWGAAKAASFLFTRLTRNRLLSQPRRALIVEAVGANPSIARSKLAQLTGLGSAILGYHLYVLKRQGAVLEERNGSRRYRLPGKKPEPKGAERGYGDLPALVHGLILKSGGRISMNTLVRGVVVETSCGRNAVWYAVESLARRGLVSKSQEGSRRVIVEAHE